MKQIWKKPLAWLMALSMMLSLMPAMATTALAEESAIDGLDFTTMDTTDRSDEGWKWDKDSKILTLDGANISISKGIQSGDPIDEIGIRLPEGATIVLNGTNTVMMTGSDSNTNDLYAIHDSGDLSIIGNGTLNVTAQLADSVTTNGIRVRGIYSRNLLTIGGNGGGPTIKVSAHDKGNRSDGVYGDSMYLLGGSITADFGYASTSANTSYGVYTYELLGIANGFKITAKGEKDIDYACAFGSSSESSWTEAEMEKSLDENGETTTIGQLHIKQKDLNTPVVLTYSGNLPTYNVTVKCNDDVRGTASADPTQGVIGTKVTLTATPNAGYQLKEWKVTDDKVTINSDNTFKMPAGNVEIQAIFEEIPAQTYSVTVTSNNDDWGAASASPTSATAGTEITLTSAPKTGYHFKEWQVLSGGVTIAENKFTMPADNVEIKAIFEEDIHADPTYAISGKVEQEVTGSNNTPVNGATVQLMKGKAAVGNPARTDAQGAFKLENIPNGIYNLAVTSSDKTVTILVEINGNDVTLADAVVFPAGEVSSKVEVKADAPEIAKDAVVGGLEEVAKANKEDGSKVEVKLELKTAAGSGSVAIQSHAKSQGKAVDLIELSVNKTVVPSSGGSVTVTSITNIDPTILEIILPKPAGKTGIKVYRYHNGAVDEFMLLKNGRPSNTYQDKTYAVDDANVYIYASKFSTYAIGHDDPNSGGTTPGTNPGGSSSGGSSGGSASTGKNPVSVPGQIDGGSVSVSPKNAKKGETVTITTTPKDGYELDKLIVTDKNGDKITTKDLGDGKYSFTMPDSKVMIEPTFVEKKAETQPETKPEEKLESRIDFIDVPAGSFFADAVAWAVEHNITSGISDTMFGPNQVCTRAQAVTFLWRAAGCPQPNTTNMPFTDVPAGSYYYDAVLWAVENGITSGISSTAFGADLICSRAQIVTLMWRAEKSPAIDAENPFSDLSAADYFNQAVLWAVNEDITSGTSASAFSPNADCTRAQIVTFLYRMAQGK